MLADVFRPRPARVPLLWRPRTRVTEGLVVVAGMWGECLDCGGTTE